LTFSHLDLICHWEFVICHFTFMTNRKLIYSILILFAILTAIIFSIVFSARKNNLNVYFLNVGQGDAILISEGQNQMLIDGGKDGGLLLQELGKYIPFWDRKIEIVVATHPDQDHIGGLIDVLGTYRVEKILKTNAESDSEVYQKLKEVISQKGLEKVDAKKDATVKFPGGTVANVLFPLTSLPEAVDEASNDNSVAIELVYGENSFLLTGDLPSAKETELINSRVDIKSDVLKVAHHGSKYSTGDDFLSATNPADAVISVGKNSYGHPNQEVLDRLLRNKVNILRTDEMGDVVYKCQNPNDKCTRVAN